MQHVTQHSATEGSVLVQYILCSKNKERQMKQAVEEGVNIITARLMTGTWLSVVNNLAIAWRI